MTTRTSAFGIPTAGVLLDAELTVPDQARGLVLFAHGSGSSRLSPRSRAVADTLDRLDLATVLVDLSTPEEARDEAAAGRGSFDLGPVADRLVGVVDWLRDQPGTADLPIGLFGASTGAAAALVTAAARPHDVRAVVSRGGRPDLAGTALVEVTSPTLLLVGERDAEVLELNREAQRVLTAGVADLRIIAGAAHLFEEPGALEQVAELAGTWFRDHLSPPPRREVRRLTDGCG